MTWVPDIHKRILVALKHGGMNIYELAEQLDEPPFRVKQELKTLRSEGFVYFRFEPEQVLWRLTQRGELYAWNAAQQELPL